MRLLILLVLILAGVAAFGFYRGWFHVTSDGTTDKSNVTLTVDKDKIQQDKNAAREKTHDLSRPAAKTATPTGSTGQP